MPILLVPWPFDAELVIGKHDETTGPGLQRMRLNRRSDAFQQSIRARFTQAHQQRTRVCAGSELTNVREVQGLGDEKASLPARGHPDIHIGLAREPFGGHGVHLMPPPFQNIHQPVG
jgi:hypothetical protein